MKNEKRERKKWMGSSNNSNKQQQQQQQQKECIKLKPKVNSLFDQITSSHCSWTFQIPVI